MKNETTEFLRTQLRRTLVGAGIDPDLLDKRQLQSASRLIEVCKKRIKDIQEHKDLIQKLKPNKTQIAEEANLTRTSISKSHNIYLLRLYNYFFPEENNDTVSVADYQRVVNDNNNLLRKLDGNEITQARLVIALGDKGKLERKNKLQAKAIESLAKIISRLKQMYLESTGEEIIINLAEILKDPETWEEEDIRSCIPISILTKSGKTS